MPDNQRLISTRFVRVDEVVFTLQRYLYVISIEGLSLCYATLTVLARLHPRLTFLVHLEGSIPHLSKLGVK